MHLIKDNKIGNTPRARVPLPTRSKNVGPGSQFSVLCVHVSEFSALVFLKVTIFITAAQNCRLQLELPIVPYLQKMRLKRVTSLFSRAMQSTAQPESVSSKTLPETRLPYLSEYKPTLYLSHPFLQSVYNIAQRKINFNMRREKLFFEDGGHISLDWAENSSQEHVSKNKQPILFMMHGLTGGSETNYIKAIMSEAMAQGFTAVCMNSRGINNPMTSPLPFTGIFHQELEAGLERVRQSHPDSPIYLVGTSFGGNYLLRYLINNSSEQASVEKEISDHRLRNIKAFVGLAPPFNVHQCVDDMLPIYQKFFVKRYIDETVVKHAMMKHWTDIGVVDMKKVLRSQTLREFHSQLTAKILGMNGADQVFHHYNIEKGTVSKLKIPTLLMTSKDDPIVSYKAFPLEQLQQNPNVSFVSTQKGGHMCWFEGIVPRRWYPKPTIKFFSQIQDSLS